MAAASPPPRPCRSGRRPCTNPWGSVRTTTPAIGDQVIAGSAALHVCELTTSPSAGDQAAEGSPALATTPNTAAPAGGDQAHDGSPADASTPTVAAPAHGDHCIDGNAPEAVTVVDIVQSSFATLRCAPRDSADAPENHQSAGRPRSPDAVLRLPVLGA